jgi:hypothetical protein
VQQLFLAQYRDGAFRGRPSAVEDGERDVDGGSRRGLAFGLALLVQTDRDVADGQRARDRFRAGGDLDLALGRQQLQALRDGSGLEVLEVGLRGGRIGQHGSDAPFGLAAPGSHEHGQPLARGEQLVLALGQLELRLLVQRLLVLQVEVGDVAGIALADGQFRGRAGGLDDLAPERDDLLGGLGGVERGPNLAGQVEHIVRGAELGRLKGRPVQVASHAVVKQVEQALHDVDLERRQRVRGKA